MDDQEFNAEIDAIKSRLDGFETGARHRERAISLLTTATLIIGVMTAIILGLGGYFTISQSNSQAQQSKQNTMVAHEAKITAKRVEKDRKLTILDNCHSQNANHDKTIKELNELLKHNTILKDQVVAFSSLLTLIEQAARKHHSREIDHTSAAFKRYLKDVQLQQKTQAQSTILLIDALQPKKNCNLVVKKATRP